MAGRADQSLSGAAADEVGEIRDRPPAAASQFPRPASRLSLAASRLSLAASRLSLAANGFPRAANGFPPAARRSPPAASQLSLAANGFPRAANEFPSAASQLSRAADRFPRAASQLSRAANRLSRAANRSPPSAGLLDPPAAEILELQGPPLPGTVTPPVAASCPASVGPLREGYGSRLARSSWRQGIGYSGRYNSRLLTFTVNHGTSFSVKQSVAGEEVSAGRKRSRLFENLNRRGAGSPTAPTARGPLLRDAVGRSGGPPRPVAWRGRPRVRCIAE